MHDFERTGLEAVSLTSYNAFRSISDKVTVSVYTSCTV